ncbi:mitochondrial genome maintenance exonuclease 1-like [Saccostrea echinata]|uniref:mitochondrial genome maintenance exonuclease 1-like n=1 Tax=Saccostrea echinata TaxID=191078 RepID=UPI002A82DF78|nr:mitochondrial genome maintenance exonuclease 1-like [Saccostrea echinata]XP_061164315.1 mitochondrial genome maintenance exonuclease 1-like [Saccostrea echinata]
MLSLCSALCRHFERRSFHPKCSSNGCFYIQHFKYSNGQNSVQDVIASIIQGAKSNDVKNKNETSRVQKLVAIKSSGGGDPPSTDTASDLEIESAERVEHKSRKSTKAIQGSSTKKILKALNNLTDEEAETLAFIKSVKLFQLLELEEKSEKFRAFVERLKLRSNPAVTRILSATQTDYQKYVLEQWKLRMIEELGVQGFEEYQKETFAKGHKLHYSIQQRLMEEEIEITPNIEGYWRSLQQILPAIEQVFTQEDYVNHPHLHYRGIFDCIAVYRGSPCVIDWKTSSKPKPTLRDTYDYPLQMVAYLGALNQSDYLVERAIPQVTSAALVVMYENGNPADIHYLDSVKCQSYWRKWLDKLHQYWLLKSREAS